MKRFITIFSIFLLLLFSMNEVNVFAELESKTLTQGIYSARDANLLIGNPITARLTSADSKAIIIVIDLDQTIEALVRLNPQVTKQILPPLNYGSSVVIYTNDSVVLS